MGEAREMMSAFGRPSLIKDAIGIVMVTATVTLMWVESSLAAGGAAAAGPDTADVGVEEVMTMTVTAPAGVDCI